MFIITGTKVELTYQVMSFMSKIYPNLIDVDIEVVQKDLTEDNVFGWTLENNDQNVRGLRDDDQREKEAYDLEGKYYQLYKCLK